MLANRHIIKFFKLSDKLLSLYKWKLECSGVSSFVQCIVYMHTCMSSWLIERGCCRSLSRKPDRSPEHRQTGGCQVQGLVSAAVQESTHLPWLWVAFLHGSHSGVAGYRVYERRTGVQY